MRFLRIPIDESDARQMPEWIIEELTQRDRASQEGRRESPRLEMPRMNDEQTLPHQRPEQPEALPSTIIIIDL
jgi:hypothetical protein